MALAQSEFQWAFQRQPLWKSQPHTSRNSIALRGYQWELGYDNGLKELYQAEVVPTYVGAIDQGNPYAHLYSPIDLSTTGALLWGRLNGNQGQWTLALFVPTQKQRGYRR